MVVERHSSTNSRRACMTVAPGVCGFQCVIEAETTEDRKVSVKITGSECEQIQRLSELLEDITPRDLFAPLSKNPVFIAAERSGCHPPCPVPVAILKAVEVAMGMALPQEVRIRFK